MKCPSLRIVKNQNDAKFSCINLAWILFIIFSNLNQVISDFLSQKAIPYKNLILKMH